MRSEFDAKPLASFPKSSFSRDFSAKLPRLSLREIFYSFSLFSSSELFFFAFSSLVANSCTSEIPYSYIYFFLVAQKSFSHHAGARKERLLRVCCFWTSSSISRRVLAAFFFTKMIG
jgi:hypothetical protein